MNTSTTTLIQSKYFTPIFNTAIFDGAVRVYFAQTQEPDALKIYAKLRDFFASMPAAEREKLKVEEFESIEARIFVMLYPTKEAYAQCFDPALPVGFTKLDGNYVVGVCAPYEESHYELIINHVEDLLLDWLQYP